MSTTCFIRRPKIPKFTVQPLVVGVFRILCVTDVPPYASISGVTEGLLYNREAVPRLPRKLHSRSRKNEIGAPAVHVRSA